MADQDKEPKDLRRFRGHRSFEAWREDMLPRYVSSSEANIQKLVEELIKLGPYPFETAARKAVGQCVRRFNRLDKDGWIGTMEREDISEAIWYVVGVCGFSPDEGWLDEREW